MSAVSITDIRIGTRHRRDMGDITELADSIRELGLLHPVVITPDRRLIAGQRRIEACRSLGWSEVPATVVDLDQIARGAYAENFFRKQFTPSEMADIADELEPRERRAAKARQQQHGGTAPGRNHSGENPHSARRALDHVAKIVGKDRKTLAKARAVRDAAEAEPERFGKLRADMDRTGRVDGPFKRLIVARQAEAIRGEPPPLPGNGPYRALAADIPWPYELDTDDPGDRATHPYPQISIAAICALGPKVRAIVHEDCVLWLWVTNYILANGVHVPVLDAWGGFKPRTILTWMKDHMGRGEWLRGQSEHCVMAVHGKPVVELTNQTTVLHAPVRANSRKPDEFYALVESLCPAPRYAELFSRKVRDGWDVHDDEV
jgi:N6-adenosine-specific RNA methylase IME4/ParB-like chromosome segregation protein Spo0J